MYNGVGLSALTGVSLYAVAARGIPMKRPSKR